MRVSSRHGFTLVELSIVLVIVGLLAGGIMAGVALVRGAELKSVGADATKYLGAISQFKTRFRALPGDITNASSYWGVAGGASGTSTVCGSTASTDMATCDGNGDLELQPTTIRIGASTSYTLGPGNIREDLRFWQHLANAGLVEGKYTGCCSTTPGTSVPKRSDTSYFSIYNYRCMSPSPTIYDVCVNYGNMLQYAATSGTPLKPSEAFELDKKIDDGLPASGGWQAPALKSSWASTAGCTLVTSTTDYTSGYALSNDSKSCRMYIMVPQ